jgi:hypothetical protein
MTWHNARSLQHPFNSGHYLQESDKQCAKYCPLHKIVTIPCWQLWFARIVFCLPCKGSNTKLPKLLLKACSLPIAVAVFIDNCSSVLTCTTAASTSARKTMGQCNSYLCNGAVKKLVHCRGVKHNAIVISLLRTGADTLHETLATVSAKQG